MSAAGQASGELLQCPSTSAAGNSHPLGWHPLPWAAEHGLHRGSSGLEDIWQVGGDLGLLWKVALCRKASLCLALPPLVCLGAQLDGCLLGTGRAAQEVLDAGGCGRSF